MSVCCEIAVRYFRVLSIVCLLNPSISIWTRTFKMLGGAAGFEPTTYGLLRMTAPEFRHSLSGSSLSERGTALIGWYPIGPHIPLTP